MKDPSFRESMDALGISLAEMAERFGRPIQSVKQMRLDPSHPGYRPPPEEWREIIAELARQKGEELQGLAEELERASA